jgi:hypothetical protein
MRQVGFSFSIPVDRQYCHTFEMSAGSPRGLRPRGHPVCRDLTFVARRSYVTHAADNTAVGPQREPNRDAMAYPEGQGV